MICCFCGNDTGGRGDGGFAEEGDRKGRPYGLFGLAKVGDVWYTCPCINGNWQS